MSVLNVLPFSGYKASLFLKNGVRLLLEVECAACTMVFLLKCIWQISFFFFAWSNLNGILIRISKIVFRFRFSFPALLPLKNVKFYFRSCQKPRKGRAGDSHVVTSFQERSRRQNKLRGPHCGDLIHFIIFYSASAKLSTKLCENTAVTSNLRSDFELSEYRQLLKLKAKQNSGSRKKLFRTRGSLQKNLSYTL